MKTDPDFFEEDDALSWLATFADLMTLLLVFFVLLYSMSVVDAARFKKAMASIQIHLGETNPAVSLLDLAGGGGLAEMPVSLADISGLQLRQTEMLQKIKDFIEESRLQQDIDLSVFDGKIHVRVKGTMLFDSGSADLTGPGKPVVSRISAILRGFPEYRINIKGHTDNVPIATEQFPSNWDLSAIRATTVLRHLIDTGVDPERLTATGYGDLLPLVANDSPAHRAINRRVEFVLEKNAP